MTPAEKEIELVALIERMQSGLTYDLAEYARLIPGEGSVDAQVLFLGEAPGADEDRLGRPFVGRSGQLLRENIRKIGWREEDVYITNVVKHRPPDNRDPLPDEIALNAPFLDQQIMIIDPLVLVTLGRFSMAKYFPNQKISSIRGHVFRMQVAGKQRIVVPLYHPAAALRSAQMKAAFVSDFSRLPQVLTYATTHTQPSDRSSSCNISSHCFQHTNAV